MKQFEKILDAQTLALAIVDTIPDPFVVLDDAFRVLAASRSFYQTFMVDPEDTRGELLYALGDGQWDIPALRLLLETIIPKHTAMDGFEVEHDFPGVGPRTMLLNARMVFYEDSPTSTILLAFKDITAAREIEREREALLARTEQLLGQNQVLLAEMRHRVANSLQIIASILNLKAKAVESEETRQHLRDAYQRVISVAEVQMHLHASDGIDRIDVQSYLTKLCSSLSSSMIAEGQAIMIEVAADQGTIEFGQAVNLGLIVTELVINAIKYAFPDNNQGGLIRVAYQADSAGWSLAVVDNGIGRQAGATAPKGSGLGTTIVQALAGKLDARIEASEGGGGTNVTIRGAAQSQIEKADLHEVGRDWSDEAGRVANDQ